MSVTTTQLHPAIALLSMVALQPALNKVREEPFSVHFLGAGEFQTETPGNMPTSYTVDATMLHSLSELIGYLYKTELDHYEQWLAEDAPDPEQTDTYGTHVFVHIHRLASLIPEDGPRPWCYAQGEALLNKAEDNV